MTARLKHLTTEQPNPLTGGIDMCSTPEMVRLMNEEDKTVPLAVERELPQIAKAVDEIARRLKAGGRLFYIGAGTSGRLGIVDASECPPTFGTDPQTVQGIIAGGDSAIFRAAESLEDDAGKGAEEILRRGICERDALVGIASSGRTPYVIGAMDAARRKGAFVVGLSCTLDPEFRGHADLLINVIVGPEVIAGSTRLKAGTAQKLVLNMLSTCTMIKLGKVYGNLMVDLRSTNDKLHDRSLRIIESLVEVSRETAEEALKRAGGSTKIAILMLKANCSKERAEALLEENDHILRRAVEASEAGYSEGRGPEEI